MTDPIAEAIARCREAINENDNLLMLATRGDFSVLLNAYDEALANYQYMVDRAADEKLDGYRELGQRAADAENQRDALEVECAALRRRIAELEGPP